MTDQQLQDVAKVAANNRIIAEFMGYRYETGITPAGTWHRYFKNDGTFEDSFPEAKYHTSWDWLMPVVEKIESIPDVIVIINREATIIRIFDQDCNCIWKTTQWDQEVKIDHVYSAVLQFITYYQKIQK